ncbi:Oxalate--CoA ligase [Porphyridium purpureum]|uniref:Oxalate--CoA ligase n=1 Tax=Porphyridium purpureum TaxID=35688 RepID=A0A5J4YMG0_PORPP|nr:Oxalate--CoA ligase [Porphyridium purpureum]|eukprot:POR0088..scf249_10
MSVSHSSLHCVPPRVLATSFSLPNHIQNPNGLMTPLNTHTKNYPKITIALKRLNGLKSTRQTLADHKAVMPDGTARRTDDTTKDASKEGKMETLCDVLSRGQADRHALREVLLNDAARAPETVFKSRDFTFATLRELVADFATQLLEIGHLKAGDAVCMVQQNSAEFVVAYLAVVSLGAVVAPLNPNYMRDEFEFYLTDTACKVLLVSGSDHTLPAVVSAVGLGTAMVVNVFDEVDGQHGHFRLEASTATRSGHHQEVPAKSSSVRADVTAMFLHTSGTTSKPKGVPLSHGNMACSVDNIVRTYELTASDTTILVMPLFHVHGLIAALLSTLASGGCVVIPPMGKFSASTFWPMVAQFGVTWYTAVPTIHQILLQRADTDFAANGMHENIHLRFIRSCSASLASSTLEQLESTFHAPVLEAYGMTEAAHQMASNPLPSHGVRKPGSVGPPQGSVSITILDEQNSEMSTPGVVGEVCIRGANVTHGYHNNAAANETAFAAGWFHTGDQGFLDTDGYLTLTGRIKELINRGGEKISPLEVDAALLSCAGVLEAVSFGAPDAKYGEVVHAAVVVKDASITEESILEHVKGRLALFKVPIKLYSLDQIPKGATGKVQRRHVAAALLQ